MTRKDAETRLDCLCIAYTSLGLNKEYIRGRDELLDALTKPVDIEKLVDELINRAEYYSHISRLPIEFTFDTRKQDAKKELDKARAALIAAVKGE
jgi:hypothetical protein